jgi:N-acetylneuraminate synthase
MITYLKNIIGKKIDSDIFIIGKGPSIDLINTNHFKSSIVINLNESELIFPGDICIFHDQWVFDYFQKNSQKCSLYVCDKKINSDVPQLTLEYVPYNPETSQFVLDRFFSKKIYMEQATLLTALKIAEEIGELSGSKKNVYLLGFDFTSKHGYTKKITTASSHHLPEYQEHKISFQERSLSRILSEKDRLFNNVVHVGGSDNSMHIDEFNRIYDKDMNYEIEKNDKESLSNNGAVIVVAEITTNHAGDMHRLFKMISLAQQAGADYVKIQKRDVETFYSQKELNKSHSSPFGSTFRDYRNGLEFDESQLEEISSYCKKIGISWFASVLDQKSYELMKKFSPDIIKLPSTISEHKDYLKHVSADFKNDVVISTGYTDKNFESFILENFKQCKTLYLLQCTSSYPTSFEDANVAVVRHYSNLGIKNSHIKSGYSSHDIGSTCSMMAVAAGANMIEKHVKLGSVDWLHFDDVAVDLGNGDFKKFVDDIRLAEKISGDQNKKINKSEHHKYWVNNN